MEAFRLPVSGVDVLVRRPAGAEDLLLAEAPACDTRLALALTSRLASPVGGGEPGWESLPVTDLDAMLLRLRQLVFGDRVLADVRCRVRECGARIDIAFRISDYLAHHRPRAPRGGVRKAEEPGWYTLDGLEGFFRLPSGGDQAAVAGAASPEQELARRCIRGPLALRARTRRQVEAVMAAMAPSLYDTLEGVCPECGATLGVPFDPQRYVLEELRGEAFYIFEEVHLLAARYHWSEQEILSLPRLRRARYAELVRRERRSD